MAVSKGPGARRGAERGDGPEKGGGLFDYRRNALSETVITTVVALLVLVLFYSLIAEGASYLLTAFALAGLVTVAFVTIRCTLSPDRLRAAQTRRTLSLASRTLEYMRGGLSTENCQEVCQILLPETQAMAVAMTDDEVVLGYAGEHAEAFPLGSPIHTAATRRVLATQKPEVFNGSEMLDVHVSPADGARGPASDVLIPAGIVAPLIVRGVSVGTLKLYYEAPHLIDETQQAIAEGLAELLSTQLSIAELDRQVELATKAELQALQSQINPHFLFNTINTISALVRTDPMRARSLLREFAAFYRQTLEDSSETIPISREVQQTERYLGFEVARFGEDRIHVDVSIAEGLEDVEVPPFIIQPIVENSVQHAMRPDGGTLHIAIVVTAVGQDVRVDVSDDGVGMTQAQAARLLEDAGPTEKGTGIAMRNVDGRLRAVFGPGSRVEVSSQPGVGTMVTLHLVGAAPRPSSAEAGDSTTMADD